MTNEIDKCVQEVSKLSLLQVLQSRFCWPSEILLKDEYEDDLTNKCMNNIATLLQRKKRILIIGCSGGGYSTYKLCEKILLRSYCLPKITVIDRSENKIAIGILACIHNLS